MQASDGLQGIERLTITEKAYLLIFNEILDTGKSPDHQTTLALLRVGHLEEYGPMFKLTDSGFQLYDFLQFKMTGKKKQPQPHPLDREA